MSFAKQSKIQAKILASLNPEELTFWHRNSFTDEPISCYVETWHEVPSSGSDYYSMVSTRGSVPPCSYEKYGESVLQTPKDVENPDIWVYYPDYIWAYLTKDKDINSLPLEDKMDLYLEYLATCQCNAKSLFLMKELGINAYTGFLWTANPEETVFSKYIGNYILVPTDKAGEEFLSTLSEINLSRATKDKIVADNNSIKCWVSPAA